MVHEIYAAGSDDNLEEKYVFFYGSTCTSKMTLAIYYRVWYFVLSLSICSYRIKDMHRV